MALVTKYSSAMTEPSSIVKGALGECSVKAFGGLEVRARARICPSVSWMHSRPLRRQRRHIGRSSSHLTRRCLELSNQSNCQYVAGSVLCRRPSRSYMIDQKETGSGEHTCTSCSRSATCCERSEYEARQRSWSSEASMVDDNTLFGHCCFHTSRRARERDTYSVWKQISTVGVVIKQSNWWL
jgi:hypothetical protein